MMRGDDADLQEIEFLIKADNINPKDLEAAYPIAYVPDIPEIKEIFLASQNAVRKLLHSLENPHHAKATSNGKIPKKPDDTGMPPP
jgi:hypothetical protein